jgi:hypothetical protein
MLYQAPFKTPGEAWDWCFNLCCLFGVEMKTALAVANCFAEGIAKIHAERRLSN